MKPTSQLVALDSYQGKYFSVPPSQDLKCIGTLIGTIVTLIRSICFGPINFFEQQTEVGAKQRIEMCVYGV